MYIKGLDKNRLYKQTMHYNLTMILGVPSNILLLLCVHTNRVECQPYIMKDMGRVKNYISKMKVKGVFFSKASLVQGRTFKKYIEQAPVYWRPGSFHCPFNTCFKHLSTVT